MGILPFRLCSNINIICFSTHFFLDTVLSSCGLCGDSGHLDPFDRRWVVQYEA